MLYLHQRLTANRYFYHYLFWAIVVLSNVVDIAELRQFSPNLFFRTLLLKNGLLIAIVYFHLRILIPALMTTKRYPLYLLCLLMTIVVGTLFANQIEQFSWRKVNTAQYELPGQNAAGSKVQIIVEKEETIFKSQNQLLLDALTVCRYLIISMLLKFIDDFFQQREQLQRIQYEKTTAELNALKSQIHPHFLFNTLNNLYGLVLEKSDEAAETVLKLSDLMKYTLTEGNADTVPLKKDIDNLRHYFNLERLRLSAQADLHFEVHGNIDNQRIAPLLLLPLVENAFTHGVHQCREKPFLKIEISIQETELKVVILNSKPSPVQAASSLGTGLQNVRKRLDLLYPNRHQFETTADEHFYRINLHLQLQ